MANKEWSYEYEERAAILEFDGGMSRAEAEREAAKQIARRRKKRAEEIGRDRRTHEY